MCGIAGLCDLSGRPASAVRVREMCDLIAHRGPDDSGVWASGPTALGHRRLSIIDVSPRGRNPMANEDESVWLVFNGEIYNHRDLRRTLDREHRFRSETDSEVLLHLYEERGIECLADLNGMFAFALWDAPRRRLVLARDRFGVKPLYYTRLGDIIAFASEAKAFLALPEFVAAPDPAAMAEYLTFFNTFGDATLFTGVKLLPAGCFLVCENERVALGKYWDLQFAPDDGPSLDDWAVRVREQFEGAVTRQLMSDVPLGSYLSGGIDTGAISAVAARSIPSMHTFTCGFELPAGATDLERHFDERDQARELARDLGTLHHELELGQAAMAPALPRVVWHLDEPRVGISYQVYYTAEMIRRHVTVVLSGVGGDELFAGYPWRYQPILDAAPDARESEHYRQSIRGLTDDEKRALFTPALNRSLGGLSTRDRFHAVVADAGDCDPLHRALYADFKVFLHGLLLVDDKLSMAHSVEARVPFLDNRLVELVAQVPARFKLQAGRSKVVLKQALRGLLPDDILRRRKQGFTPPDESWYRQDPAFIRGLILGPRALSRGYFEPSALGAILEDHVSGRRNHRFLLWWLMCFEWWNRLFVDREPVPEPPVFRTA